MELKGFIGPSYTLQNSSVEAQRTVNLYPQVDESGVGKNIASFIPTPGLTLFANLGGSPGRGILTTAKGRLFIVDGAVLSELISDGSVIARGTLATDLGRVGMAENGLQIMIVDGPNGYGYDLNTNVLAQLVDFPGGVTVAFQDGYFIFNKPNSQQFYISGLYSTSVDPLDFATAEGSPDNLVSLMSDHEEVWLFGTQTTEVWFNSGAPLFPFTRIDGAFITHGTAAAFSPAKLDNTIYWLGQDESGSGMVWKAAGYQPVRCSTHAMEQAIAQYPRISDATGFSYQQDGHAFYVLNFPSGNATWVFDAATQLWHERAFTGANGLERHRAEMHTVAFGKHILTDYADGSVYFFDRNNYTDNGTNITKIRTAPYVQDGLNWITFHRLQLDMKMGLQLDGDSPMPQGMLQWSDDGGHSWSNEHWIELGAVGDENARAIWRRLGNSRSRVFRFTVTDPVPVYLTNAYIDIEMGIA